MPMISVVMSVYNGGRYLKLAVSSILDQTYQDFEFIVIDDGSTDNSLEILKNFEVRDRRIKIISRKNKGLVFSLNEGIEMAQGEYIARMDADDISRPDRLGEQLKYMQANDLAVCGTWADGIDEYGKKIKSLDYPPGSEKIRNFILVHNPFIHSSIIFQKDLFKKVGGYKNFFKHTEDYELWTRSVFKYKTGNIPKRLLEYRIHSEQITRRNNFTMKMGGIIVRILALVRFIFRF